MYCHLSFIALFIEHRVDLIIIILKGPRIFDKWALAST